MTQPTEDPTKTYETYYVRKNPDRVYPTEFVVRAFLAKYPRHELPRQHYRGTKILDLGFGDGRNTEFLCDQGFDVYGTEISEEICRLTNERMESKGYRTTLRVGRNNDLPYADGFFDYLLACHSCYYVDPGETFAVNLREISRVLRSGGRFVASVPMASNHYLKGCDDLGDGMKRITNDPYGIRNGTIVMGLESEEQLRRYLAPHFKNVAVGSCRNDFWGIEEHVYIFSCEKT